MCKFEIDKWLAIDEGLLVKLKKWTSEVEKKGLYVNMAKDKDYGYWH